MESQMHHDRTYGGETHGHHHDTAPHADEEHHEKKSVIKKVKAKAKKIKDKLTHGHGHHDDDQQGHDHEEEEYDDDDEDEEMVQDPEIHGAPIYESAAVRSGVAGPGANTAGGNYLERPSVKQDKHHDDSHIYDPPVRPFGQWQEENWGQGRPTETHHAPVNKNVSFNPNVASGGLARPTETHHAPVDKNVSFNPNVASRGLARPTETHYAHVDKNVSFNPNVAAPASDIIGHGRDVIADRPGDKIGELPAIEEDPHAPKRRTGATTAPSSYESKVTDPTGAGGKEAGITSLLHSMDKMGIYDEKPKPGEETRMDTGSHDQFAPEPVPKSFNPDKPEELPRDTLTGHQSSQSSYTEKISSAGSAIAGKAVAAKDAIATKLGYTGAESNTGSQGTAKSASPTEYAQKIAATVTEKLAPVYGKVADAGSTVISKVQATATGTGTEQQVEKGTDKGVSVTAAYMERFKPGDEDKALSEVITHALHRGNEEKGKEEVAKSGEGKPISEKILDAFHKRGTGEVEHELEREGIPVGKVTESVEVKRRLGTGEEREHSSVGESTDTSVSTQKGGVVDRLKGAVSSWIGGGAQPQSSGTTYVTDEGLSSSGGGQNEPGVQNAGGERRVHQESSN